VEAETAETVAEATTKRVVKRMMYPFCQMMNVVCDCVKGKALGWALVRLHPLLILFFDI